MFVALSRYQLSQQREKKKKSIGSILPWNIKQLTLVSMKIQTSVMKQSIENQDISGMSPTSNGVWYENPGTASVMRLSPEQERVQNYQKRTFQTYLALLKSWDCWLSHSCHFQHHFGYLSSFLGTTLLCRMTHQPYELHSRVSPKSTCGNVSCFLIDPWEILSVLSSHYHVPHHAIVSLCFFKTTTHMTPKQISCSVQLLADYIFNWQPFHTKHNCWVLWKVWCI